nr:unnamed protein product [Digitaria exilis]
MPPPPPNERRPKHPGRVHPSTIKGPARQHVGSQHEPHGERRDGADVSTLGVDHRGVVGVHEPERHDGLEQHRVPVADAGGQREPRRARPARGEAQQQRRRDGAQQLRHPVEDGADERDAAADERAEGDGRVHVPARDVDGHGHRRSQGQRVRQRHGHQPARPVERTEREDGALGGEDEDGGGEELGDGGADGVRVRGVLAPPHRKPPPRPHPRAHL